MARRVGSGNLASCSGAEAPTSEAFFNVRGTWHFFPHGAPLWFAVRSSVLWPDDPAQHAGCQGYPIQPPGAHNPVALWAERPDHWPGF